jgi:hypothetical protein
MTPPRMTKEEAVRRNQDILDGAPSSVVLQGTGYVDINTDIGAVPVPYAVAAEILAARAQRECAELNPNIAALYE